MRPMVRRFFDLLRGHKRGDILSSQEIRGATGWSEATLATYLGKNKLQAFLRTRGDATFEVLRDGSQLTEVEVTRALSQRTAVEEQYEQGQRLDGSVESYDLVEYLDRGAVAEVWIAEGCDTKARVAAKIVNPRRDLLEPSVLPNVISRFRREVNNGKKLQSDFIVRYRDTGSIRKSPFLVMELATRSLAAVLMGGSLSLNDSLLPILRVVRGLEYLHHLALVHRDIKPKNLLETERGVVLGDLGIVRWDHMNKAFTSAGTITKASVQLGSWEYMAPEQKKSPHETTPASDVYALGVTWYELLSGDKPTPEEFAAGEAPDATTDCDVAQIIRKMTSFKSSMRPHLSEIRSLVEQRGVRIDD